RTVAGACDLLEELLEREWRNGAIGLRLGTGPHTILLHGHCHQKAMGLLTPAKTLLARVPGANVVDLDAGCCGMAGAFGYPRRDYQGFKMIGERPPPSAPPTPARAKGP